MRSSSSPNIVNVETSALFEALHKSLDGSISDHALQQRLREAVDAMQVSAGTRSFLERYKDFIALAADHVTVFAPFLPALTQLDLESLTPSKSKPIIDEIDTVLAGHYGFTAEELDFILNYDIKYRLGRTSETEE